MIFAKRCNFFPFTITFFTLVLACANNKSLNNDISKKEEIDVIVQKAASRFSVIPRKFKSVFEAYELMSQAIRQINANDSLRYDYLCTAAKYATWLSFNSNQNYEKSRFASGAMELAKKAVRLNNRRVEGYYFRAIAMGLFAEANKFQARDVMNKIRNDALQAIAIDKKYDHGGPHRLLGALYLRAPGPPAGIGSSRKALQHFQKAYEISPTYPENLNFLAEVYIKTESSDKAGTLLDQVISSTWSDGELISRHDWQNRALELKKLIENQKK